MLRCGRAKGIQEEVMRGDLGRSYQWKCEFSLIGLGHMSGSERGQRRVRLSFGLMGMEVQSRHRGMEKKARFCEHWVWEEDRDTVTQTGFQVGAKTPRKWAKMRPELSKYLLPENRLVSREQTRWSLETEASWPLLWRGVFDRSLISARSGTWGKPVYIGTLYGFLLSKHQ